MKIERTKNKFLVSQSSYVAQVLEKYRLENVRMCSTPMDSQFYEPLKTQFNGPIIKGELHPGMIGSLLFRAYRTKSDISLAVGILLQYTSKPTRFLLK